MADSYTVSQAAALLGVTDRRVRQLAAAGTLPVVGEHPTRLDAVAVIAARSQRASRQADQTPAANQSGAVLDVDQLRAMVGAIVGEILPRALEGRDRVEELLQTELAQARAQAAAAEATAAQLRLEMEQLRAGKRWRKKAKKAKK